MSRKHFGFVRTATWVALGCLLCGLTGCKEAAPKPDGAPPAGKPAASAAIRIRSGAFEAGKAIPAKHTGEGQDVSPPLSWTGVPAGTKELALIVDDPDAPRDEPWVHWVIYGIPADADALPEGVAKTGEPAGPPGAAQGKNSWGKVGYGGPMPPKGHGVHHYRFRLYALDAALGLPPGAEKGAVLAAAKGHILAEGELVGTYERK